MKEYFTNIDWSLELLNLFKLGLAVILGFAIGYERKRRYKEAGIRTHTIVCLGSALMMLVSIYGFGGEADAARVAAQIVSGVGFLGAGIIVYRKHETKGLTTAAGVWATAGVGMACGGGLYILAIAATALMITAQVLFHQQLICFPVIYQKHLTFCGVFECFQSFIRHMHTSFPNIEYQISLFFIMV